jgi:hypothetical protein
MVETQRHDPYNRAMTNSRPALTAIPKQGKYFAIAHSLSAIVAKQQTPYCLLFPE